MPLASHERSRSMGPLQGFRRGPVVPTTSPQGAFRNSLRKLKLFSFTPASPSSRKTRCAIFAGALKLSHKTRFAIFAGALKARKNLLAPEEEAPKLRIQQPFRLAFGKPPSRRRKENAASVRKFPHNGKFPSSQVAKSPPGSSQESTCSPLTQGGLQ